jgi:predicted porin
MSLVTLTLFHLAAYPAFGADKETLDRLEKIIRQQQSQIEAQQKALEQLQGEVAALKGASPAATQTTVPESDKVLAEAVSEEQKGAVLSGNTSAKIKLYGQVNKAVLYSNDGDDGNFYLVDNDNSSTRIGVLGTIHPSDKYEVGTRLEFEYQTNPSNLVNQEDKRVEDLGFEKRHLDLWVDSNSIGKFSLGWGSTASDGTSEMDLSGTGVIGYSSIADMAGGQLFFNKNTGALSDTPIIAVYSNLDGLGREERIRYDSPSFNGFVGSASYVAEGGGDLAVRYTAQMNAFKLAAAAAYANPGSSSIFIEDQLAGSVSVLHDSGFNGTFAMGTRDQKGAGVNDAGFFYTKFGYRGSWCPLGVTYLSADFGRFSDFDVNGDDADTVGLQMVQDLETWGSEAYLGYRFHKLDRNGVDFDTINAIMTGMRVKF